MLAILSLDVVPLAGVFCGTLLAILLSSEFGFRAGRWRRARSDQEKEGPVGGMVAAELGLLAFLLAFIFGIAAARFDERRRLVIDEANAIGTAYLRAALLPEPPRAETRGLLRDYVNARTAHTAGMPVRDMIQKSEAMHTRLWAQVVAVSRLDNRSVPAGLFTQAVNDVIDIHSKRVQTAIWGRVPITVWAVLLVVVICSFAAMGYQSGLAGAARSPAVVAIAITFAVVIWMVVDLERPLDGLLRVSQQPLVDVRNSMINDPP